MVDVFRSLVKMVLDGELVKKLNFSRPAAIPLDYAKTGLLRRHGQDEYGLGKSDLGLNDRDEREHNQAGGMRKCLICWGGYQRQHCHFEGSKENE